MSRGKYIVFEGPGGTGKTTQLLNVATQLKAAGLPVRMFREPDSQSDLTARTIRLMTQDPRYPMNTRTEVLLYNAARSQSLEVIRHSVSQGVICLVDRNYLTTLAIQYYGRGNVPDYATINNIIAFAVGGFEPDLTIILDAPVDTLVERTRNRGQGERFDNLDREFLERVRAGYLWEAKARSLPVVLANGTTDEVFKDVWKLVTATLADRTERTDSPAASVVTGPAITEPLPSSEQPNETMSGPLLRKTKQGNWQITLAGREFLSGAITNVDGDVYAFTDQLSPTTVAAAMARLSRRGDDMRVTLLDEFAGNQGKDEALLKRIITAYGDDSVQQLAGMHLVVEGASNILTKKLEWGRLASYLEQSTRYIFLDQKDELGRYRYYVPSELDDKTKQNYQTILDEIFNSYSRMAHSLTEYVQTRSDIPEKDRDGAWRAACRAQACDAIRPVLPVATKLTVGIFGSGQAIESMIMHLLSDPLPEARVTGQRILDEARKVIPTFLERADKPDRGGAAIAYRANTAAAMRSIAEKQLPSRQSSSLEAVELTDYWPKNEFDLLPAMLYEHSNLSLHELEQAVQSWPYEQKEHVFKTYFGERLNRRNKPGRALEMAHYSWDLLCDYGIFRDLQRHRMVDALEWQLLSPRYGFEIPELVEEAGLSDGFEHCFALSTKLYSDLQSAGYALEAQYATLLGHKMRWKVMFNARQAFHLLELRSSPQGHPGYRKLSQVLHEKLAEVHPLIGEAMVFVNKGEDPALTRLAAEKYTQFKLQQLDRAEKD